MVVIAVASLKGGVGKSTTVVNLAALAARGDERVLVWDLDPQGAATHQLVREELTPPRARDLVERRGALGRAARPTRVSGVDLVPAGLKTRKLDGHLRAGEGLVRRFRPSLEKTYRWLLVDCPAGAGRVAETMMREADLVLVPVVPNPLSLHAFERLAVFLSRGHRRGVLIPFFTMVRPKGRLDRELMASFRAAETSTCAAVIPYRSEVERAAARRRPLVLARPSSPVTLAYIELWAEIRGLPSAWRLSGPRAP